MSGWRNNKQYFAEIVRLFVVKRKQQRFLDYLESDNDVRFCHELLNDERNLKDECLTELSKGEKSPEALLAKLKSLGAGKTAFIVSCYDELNGQTGELDEIVLAESFEGNGTLIFCVGTRLAYWRDDVGTLYLLQGSN